MNLKQLMADKRVQVGGLAAAAGVGALALYRRKQTTGSTTSSPAVSVAPSGATGARYDSTGTDVANWLGNYSGGLQTQLDAYNKQLQDALSGLKKVPTEAPPQATPGAGHTRTMTAAGGLLLSNFLAQTGTTYEQLLALNPGLPSYLADISSGGFVTPSNPAKGPVVKGFGGDRQIIVPA